MNYRHAFHAGNFADVLKHAVLALVIEHLKLKPKPFRVIDTHAGAGLYRLDGPEAQRTGEWQQGIGRLLGAGAEAVPDDVRELLAPYLAAVAHVNPPGALDLYPGSPALALALMRADDRLVASELHPEDGAELRRAIGRDPRARVLALDGWTALKANLPPKERRGLVLIDPPFEEPGELERMAEALTAGLRRFATGIFLLWLPLKDPRAVAAFEAAIARLELDKVIWAELRIAPRQAGGKLAGTALVIVNPPFRLEGQLATLLAFLAGRLGNDAGAGWSVRAPGLLEGDQPQPDN